METSSILFRWFHPSPRGVHVDSSIVDEALDSTLHFRSVCCSESASNLQDEVQCWISVRIVVRRYTVEKGSQSLRDGSRDARRSRRSFLPSFFSPKTKARISNLLPSSPTNVESRPNSLFPSQAILRDICTRRFDLWFQSFPRIRFQDSPWDDIRSSLRFLVLPSSFPRRSYLVDRAKHGLVVPIQHRVDCPRLEVPISTCFHLHVRLSNRKRCSIQKKKKRCFGTKHEGESFSREVLACLRPTREILFESVKPNNKTWTLGIVSLSVNPSPSCVTFLWMVSHPPPHPLSHERETERHGERQTERERDEPTPRPFGVCSPMEKRKETRMGSDPKEHSPSLSLSVWIGCTRERSRARADVGVENADVDSIDRNKESFRYLVEEGIHVSSFHLRLGSER